MKFLLVAVVLAGALAAVLVISTPRVSTPMAPLRPLNSKPSYFVSPNGSDSNPGTDARPFLSLNKAYKAAAPGETVEVEGGDYTAQQTIGYDATKEGASEPVTFIAKDHAHFEAIQPTNSYRTKIEASQVTFQGQFKFDLVLLREDVHGMSDITFRGAWIHALFEAGNVNGFFLYNNKLGPNNIWPNTGTSRTADTGPDDILDLGVGKVCIQPTGCYNYSAKNVKIVGNTFNGAFKSWTGSHSDCIQYTVGQSGYIASNTFQNCEDETLILRDNLGGLSNITIENNVLSPPKYVAPIPMRSNLSMHELHNSVQLGAGRRIVVLRIRFGSRNY